MLHGGNVHVLVIRKLQQSHFQTKLRLWWCDGGVTCCSFSRKISAGFMWRWCSAGFSEQCDEIVAQTGVVWRLCLLCCWRTCYRRTPNITHTSPSSSLNLFKILMDRVSFTFLSNLIYSVLSQSITRWGVQSEIQKNRDTNNRTRGLGRNWKAALLFGKRFRAQMKTIFHWFLLNSSCCATHHRLSNISGKR